MEIRNAHFAIITLVGIAGYLIPLYFGNIWLAIGCILSTGIIFVALLVGNSRQFFKSKNAYRLLTLLAVVFVVAHTLRYSFDYNRRDLQTELLLEIRKTIEIGVANSDVKMALFEVLREYHLNDGDSIVNLANEMLEDRLTDEHIFLSKAGMEGYEKEELTEYFYESDNINDEFQVIVVSNIPNGEDPEFKNYNGNVGRLEMVFELSTNGVFYEIRN